MRILLTNDDGVTSAGLLALRQRLGVDADDHEVWVVAPDGERSGTSHSITLREPIRSRVVEERVFAVSGSPADCVLSAVLGIMPEPPDVVVSGINVGPNLGTDITYSGTAAAARQAVYMGIPSLAVSLNAFRPPFFFDPLAKFVARNLHQFVACWDGHHFVNLNGPNDPNDAVVVKVTHPCRRIYRDRLVRFDAPSGDTYWFLEGTPVDTDIQAETDWGAVKDGFVSLSPIHVHPMNSDIDKRYRDTRFFAPVD